MSEDGEKIKKAQIYCHPERGEGSCFTRRRWQSVDIVARHVILPNASEDNLNESAPPPETRKLRHPTFHKVRVLHRRRISRPNCDTRRIQLIEARFTRKWAPNKGQQPILSLK
jgi:hypothetical protein